MSDQPAGTPDIRELRPPGFADLLPSQSARDCLLAWRRARRDDLLPALGDFAPQGLPAAVLPWLLIHRLRADGELVFGVVGEELVRWFGKNPKGQPILGGIPEEERQARIAIVHQSLSSGMPFWFEGTLLLENKEHLPIGRLCLPARHNAERVLVLIYFVLQHQGKLPRLRAFLPGTYDAARLVWCREEDLAP